VHVSGLDLKVRPFFLHLATALPALDLRVPIWTIVSDRERELFEPRQKFIAYRDSILNFLKVCNIEQRGIVHRDIFLFLSQSSDLISMTVAK